MEISREGDHSTFYVDVTGRTTLVCPSCHKKRVLDATPYREVATPLRVNCPCGQSFFSSFEYRKNYIKKVDLEGVCVDPKTGVEANVKITRLSIEGTALILYDDAEINHGQLLTLRFTLDNAQKTQVERSIKVTSVKGDEVGAMFLGGVRNKTVGFYLMP